MRQILLFSVLLTALFGCTNQSEPSLKNGDFLFLYAMDDSLSQAINTVTENSTERHYSHQGIVQISGGDTLVYHSAPNKGVVRDKLSAFRMDSEGNERGMDIYRMHDSMKKHLPVIWKRANILLGKPYNETYVMEDDGFYCSEFIYALYSTYNIFELEPMNFKNPETGTYPKAWIDHYQKLDMQIPEGKPGCNPNGMAKSPFLTKVH